MSLFKILSEKHIHERNSENGWKLISKAILSWRRAASSQFGRFFVVSMVLGFLVLLSHDFHIKSPSNKEVYALLDARVIDHTGHPAAGAAVLIDEQMVGVTDAFGEWREFRKVKLGQLYKLSFKKSLAHISIEGEKLIRIDHLARQDHGDYHLKFSLVLHPEDPSTQHFSRRTSPQVTSTGANL